MNASFLKKQDLYVQDVESLDDIDSFQLPPQTLSTDWFQEALSNTFAFSLLRDESHLCFIAFFPENASSHPEDDTGSFIEGLWKYDVAELFVTIDDSRYLEVNLSPQAAYWAARFDSYRSKAAWKPDIPAICSSRALESGMQVSRVYIPHRWYLGEQDHTVLSLNVCGIRHPAGKDPVYISAALPVDSDPDFHLRELRQVVAVVS